MNYHTSEKGYLIDRLRVIQITDDQVHPAVKQACNMYPDGPYTMVARHVALQVADLLKPIFASASRTIVVVNLASLAHTVFGQYASHVDNWGLHLDKELTRACRYTMIQMDVITDNVALDSNNVLIAHMLGDVSVGLLQDWELTVYRHYLGLSHAVPADLKEFRSYLLHEYNRIDL